MLKGKQKSKEIQDRVLSKKEKAKALKAYFYINSGFVAKPKSKKPSLTSDKIDSIRTTMKKVTSRLMSQQSPVNARTLRMHKFNPEPEFAQTLGTVHPFNSTLSSTLEQLRPNKQEFRRSLYSSELMALLGRPTRVSPAKPSPHRVESIRDRSETKREYYTSLRRRMPKW